MAKKFKNKRSQNELQRIVIPASSGSLNRFFQTAFQFPKDLQRFNRLHPIGLSPIIFELHPTRQNGNCSPSKLVSPSLSQESETLKIFYWELVVLDAIQNRKKQDNIFQEKETNKEQGNSLRIATLSNDYEAHKFVYIGNVTWIERPTICNSLSFTVFFLHTHTRMLYAYCSGYTIEKDVTTMWPSVGHALSIVTKGYAARAPGQHRDGKHEKKRSIHFFLARKKKKKTLFCVSFFSFSGRTRRPTSFFISLCLFCIIS